MKQGNIGVTTENIFPVIKKFLYSDHEIFLREIVSNAVDATQKLKTLSGKGEFKGELGDLKVTVSVDKDAKTITVTDRGIGMTADEIEKYINQIAFSGANDFLDKYKDDANAIIGHFGLGFYSSFMVSKQVDIITKSYQDAPAMKWSCDGSPSFTLEEADKTDRGTSIVMHIDDDCQEFLEKNKIEELLRKYCHFLPVPVAFGKKTEWKDGRLVDTEEDNIINNVEPLWIKKPNDLKDEDYKEFYRHLFPMADEPLFWIHLNVDYPFNLTGILYFPKIKNNIEMQRNKIQLYCNQVFVTDSVESIVPEFLTLLHGVIDSPDIPLNVSRSYLQSDSNVKKISSYITKKVSDRLASLFKTERADFEKKWDDIKIFIHYGMLSEEDFYEKATKYFLLKDTEGKYFTLDEYKTLIKDNQTNKDGQLVYLYANDPDAQYTYIEAAKQKGYSVLLMDGQLDTPLVGMLERKLEKSTFTRVDGDVIDRLIQKEETKRDLLEAERGDKLSSIFNSQMPRTDKTDFHVEVQALGEEQLPVMITQSEYMRRMKEMARLQPGMSFYGDMPDMYTLVLNTDAPLIKQVLEDSEANTADALKPIEAEIKGLSARQAVLRQEQDKKKPEEITQEEKDDMKKCGDDIQAENKKKNDVLKAYADGNERVHQLIDLALLQNGMLNHGFVKVASAIPSVRVADCQYNVEQIESLIVQAEGHGVEIICLPELSLTAYTCQDLFQQQLLLEEAEMALIQLMNFTRSLDIISIVGLPVPYKGSLLNCAAVIQKGKILGMIPKTYLPNYKEFYEKRWFTSGIDIAAGTLLICGQQVPLNQYILFRTPSCTFGVEICEDVWAPIPPSSYMAMQGAEIIFNLSADNDLVGKYDYLKGLLAQQSARTISGYVFSSCGYGESTQDVVFSAKGLIYENGNLLAETPRHELSTQLLETEIDVERIRMERRINTTFATCASNSRKDLATIIETERTETREFGLTRKIDAHPFVPTGKDLNERCQEIFSIQTEGLAKRISHTGAQTVVVGISGGLDSTLALLVCVKAFDRLGISRRGIVGITMPGFGTTDRTYTNAVNLMNLLGITIREISIKDACVQHFKDLGHDAENHDVTYENSQARERTQILMDAANQMNGLVIGTGDLSELALGWATYNGDHMSMYGVNTSVPKTLVRHLVKWVADSIEDDSTRTVLHDIVDTPISPELIPADEQGNITQKTEDLVGPYELHDFFLYYTLRWGFRPKKVYFLTKEAYGTAYTDETIKHWLKTFYRRFFAQQFKRSCLPDGPKVGSCSLSPRGDWRMPSDASSAMWLKECENL